MLRRILSILSIVLGTLVSTQAYGLVITGKVIDGKDVPVAKARVSLIAPSPPSYAQKIDASVLTSDNGSFQIEAADSSDPQMMQLMIESDGHAIAQARVLVREGETAAKRIELAPTILSAPIQLRAQFLDPAGKPVAGLKVAQRRALGDSRGFFSRLFCNEELLAAGWTKPIAQLNHSYSAARDHLRGASAQPGEARLDLPVQARDGPRHLHTSYVRLTHLRQAAMHARPRGSEHARRVSRTTADRPARGGPGPSGS